MKTVKLSDEGIDLIKEALNMAYYSIIDVANKNKLILGRKIEFGIHFRAKTFLDIQSVFDVKNDLDNSDTKNKTKI